MPRCSVLETRMPVRGDPEPSLWTLRGVRALRADFYYLFWPVFSDGMRFSISRPLSLSFPFWQPLESPLSEAAEAN